ncbi:thiamin biosynthesis lipoprotein ApbE [Candidatus Termititenax dinenymphae]|uniref:FAD:protein FMN transferase n=1 Tax=Candidatus Termititenax dinenymphae TaxID=2218523 RepID=A0A388TKP7_9BACT|nr:thiamin biosynthesis lipoprotein ApbE [Candidatus Termititenax dinenymphae]
MYKRVMAVLFIGSVLLTGCGNQKELKRQGYHLDTIFEVQLKTDNKKDIFARAQRSLNEGFDRLVELDSNINKLSPLSEISAINANASVRTMDISKITYDLLDKSLNASVFTDGYFDIVWRPLTKLFEMSSPSAERIARARSVSGYNNIALDRSLHRVRYLNTTEVDFEQIKRGFAVDLIRSRLSNVDSGQIKAGNVAYYFGSKKLSLKLTEKENLNLKLNNAAVAVLDATDSYYVNSSAWRKYLPVVSPVDPIRQIIVVAPTAVTAEVLSNAFYFMGVEKSLQKIDSIKKEASRQSMYEVYFVLDDDENGSRVVSSVEKK